MGAKIKMFGALTFIGLIGFLLGIAANFVYFKALPILMEVSPNLSQILEIDWVMWGLMGAFLSVIYCLIYAYLP